MAGKTTTACTHEQYETIIKTLYEGIGDCIQPNPRIATILVIEANVGSVSYTHLTLPTILRV